LVRHVLFVYARDDVVLDVLVGIKSGFHLTGVILDTLDYSLKTREVIGLEHLSDLLKVVADVFVDVYNIRYLAHQNVSTQT
jgi:hypothetical protein